jgi:hypothetical protein
VGCHATLRFRRGALLKYGGVAERIVAADRNDEVGGGGRHALKLSLAHVRGDVAVDRKERHCPSATEARAKLAADIGCRSDIDLIVKDRVAEQHDVAHDLLPLRTPV